jgi:integrase
MTLFSSDSRSRAVQLLEFLPLPEFRKPLFGLTASSLDALFRKAKERCVITDLTFHDSRHEAITRLSKKWMCSPWHEWWVIAT